MSKQNQPPPPAQVAYTLAQFAKLFGKNRSWAYRLAASGKIKTINGYGCSLVPATEVDRLTGADNNMEGVR
jgi:hypothetical protein